MKIINKTKWQTPHLRAFVSQVMKRAPEYLKQQFVSEKHRQRLLVRFDYNKAGKESNYVTGRAYLNSYDMQIMVGSAKISKPELAKVIMHELAHTLGYTHADMAGNALFMRVGNWLDIYAWAEDLPLELVQPKAKPKGAELQTIRHERVLAAKDRWTAKLKRAQNALRKLNRQDRYYANALASRKPKEATDVAA